MGVSLRWLLLLQSAGSRAHGLSSCGAQAQLPRGMWDLPRPETEPVSPTRAGGLLCTGPPGKPHRNKNTGQGHEAHSHRCASIGAPISRMLSPSQLDPLSPLVAHAPPPAPGPHLLFSVSMRLAPRRTSWKWILQGLSCGLGLISPSTMSSRLIYAAACVRISFLFKAEQHTIKRVQYILFNPLQTPGLFSGLTVMNRGTHFW